jgi:hypothetical protein
MSEMNTVTTCRLVQIRTADYAAGSEANGDSHPDANFTPWHTIRESEWHLVHSTTFTLYTASTALAYHLPIPRSKAIEQRQGETPAMQ